MSPTVLVLGATGAVGSGVVAALLEAGYRVCGVGRNADSMTALAAHHAGHSGLTLLQGSVAGDAAASELAERVRGQNPHAVVACLAGPLQRGRLLEHPITALQGNLELDLLPHLAAARHLIPVLADSGPRECTEPTRYLMVGATGAQRGWAGYGQASVTAAAQAMLAKVLHEEAAPLGVRVQMLSLDNPVCDPGDAQRNNALWPSALSVGRGVVALLRSQGTRVEPIVRFSQPWMPPPLPDVQRHRAKTS